jgi:superfamily I DNA/RNA helicase
VTVVGDDAQAIYSFRAASVENIRAFPDQYPSALIELEDNYRSTQAVLDAANALIGKNLRSGCAAIGGKQEKPNGLGYASSW